MVTEDASTRLWNGSTGQGRPTGRTRSSRSFGWGAFIQQGRRSCHFRTLGRPRFSLRLQATQLSSAPSDSVSCRFHGTVAAAGCTSAPLLFKRLRSQRGQKLTFRIVHNTGQKNNPTTLATRRHLRSDFESPNELVAAALSRLTKTKANTKPPIETLWSLSVAIIFAVGAVAIGGLK